MPHTVHERIKKLIEGTHEAFEGSGSMNTDYAGFASMALQDFKSALKNPDLTAHELRKLIRKGQTSHREESPQECWATFIAHYVSSNANGNLRDMANYSLDVIYKTKQE